ncbi:hypothetical protein GCM10010976_19310 [Bizionia arctica]|uniref:Uncharacterized protein n=2 Tax=Bizionia arctica TaxID=1495645 RepID=A0A917GJP4_9FLAO|nr:hypothetical protein GCM10010976_19310 [Bizionia arctica]
MLIVLSNCKHNSQETLSIKPNPVNQVAFEVLSDENFLTQDVNLDLGNSWVNDIQLDNGKKWTANPETNIGVEKMKGILKNQVTDRLSDYHNLAIQLTSEKNYVIKECTMKGPSHENLHIWLLPLMEKLEALSEAKNIVEALEIKNNIIENVEGYDHYFQ